jgi:hypothetical protein
MIAVRLDGGLGNQLFQYGTGRALALRHSTELLLDLSALGRGGPGRTVRQYERPHFTCQARQARAAELGWPPLLKRVPWLASRFAGWKFHRERSLEHDSAVEALPDNTYLAGYWQSYRYFDGIAATLANELQASAPLSQQSQALADALLSDASVAVHVRRGDYVSLAAATRMHGALPLTYYRMAIEHLRQGVQGPRFYVFSDDPAWCAAHLPLAPAECRHVAHNGGEQAWQDLVLMARCRHHIIANSSFSWWGAWLADQRHGTAGRMVLAPSRWFAGLEHDVRDRYPPHWRAVW